MYHFVKYIVIVIKKISYYSKCCIVLVSISSPGYLIVVLLFIRLVYVGLRVCDSHAHTLKMAAAHCSTKHIDVNKSSNNALMLMQCMAQMALETPAVCGIEKWVTWSWELLVTRWGKGTQMTMPMPNAGTMSLAISVVVTYEMLLPALSAF